MARFLDSGRLRGRLELSFDSLLTDRDVGAQVGGEKPSAPVVYYCEAQMPHARRCHSSCTS